MDRPILTPAEADELRDHMRQLFRPSVPLVSRVLQAVNERTKAVSYRVIVESGDLVLIARAHNRFTADYRSRNGITLDANTARTAMIRIQQALEEQANALRYAAGLVNL